MTFLLLFIQKLINVFFSLQKLINVCSIKMREVIWGCVDLIIDFTCNQSYTYQNPVKWLFINKLDCWVLKIFMRFINALAYHSKITEKKCIIYRIGSGMQQFKPFSLHTHTHWYMSTVAWDWYLSYSSSQIMTKLSTFALDNHLTTLCICHTV